MNVLWYSNCYDWLPKQLGQVGSPKARLQVQFSLRWGHLNLGICMQMYSYEQGFEAAI